MVISGQRPEIQGTCRKLEEDSVNGRVLGELVQNVKRKEGVSSCKERNYLYWRNNKVNNDFKAFEKRFFRKRFF